MSEKKSPSMDEWLKEAKADPNADKCGMYLVHNGVVRSTAKAIARGLAEPGADAAKEIVTSMEFSYDANKVESVIEETYRMEGIWFVKVWLNEGHLEVGDDIMYVMIGGDIRPRVVDALNFLVGTIKDTCVIEKECYEN
ncbi:MAG: molybdenum cofactor biosynthesis protein MoaE [Lachnospiraceae bacterium]|nr:molybdenum cofactor biosynthesis protein MoaE [Lachnospiraceae bacterium]